MRSRRSGLPEGVALLLLFAGFLAAVYHYKQAGNEVLPHNTASSLNAKPIGAKAVYLLLSRLGYRADRLESGWRSLTGDDGLAIIIEPIAEGRSPSQAEILALRTWIEKGGTALYSVTSPPRPLDPNDPLAGDLAIIAGSPAPETVDVPPSESPLLHNIHRITVNCPVRLEPQKVAGYRVLASDDSGALIAVKTIGKGRLIVVADADLTANNAILNEDNVQFVVNVATAAIGSSGKNILFDEYHHGAGFEGNEGDSGQSILANTPMPIRLTLLHLVALTGLIVYNGNRRFGAPRRMASTAPRLSTDYIRSMARLYRRSRSADLALISIFTGFRRELTQRLDLPPNASNERIVDLVNNRYAVDAQQLGTLLQRCAEVSAGVRIAEPELKALTGQISEWQRRLELVGV